MTDITDQDRRAAMAWAKNWQGDQDGDTSAAARVIIATVDAPEPTLAEELRKVAADYDRDGYPEPDETYRHLATRADQMEHDLTEAHAKVEQAEDRAAEWQGIAQRDYAKVELLAADLAEARAEVERLTAVAEDYARRATAALTERDEARAEVERLDAERLDRNPETKARVEAALNNLDQVEKVTVQKAAESDAESPDPADVKPGEAWLVECRGERRTAVKDRDDDEPWNTFTAGGLFLPEDNEAITLISRLVPAPRVITNADDLDRLPHNSVILSADNDAWQKSTRTILWSSPWWDASHGGPAMWPSERLCDEDHPVTVLWEPGA